MRIGALELLRYGRFTNASLDFPALSSDVHIIYGPNEAGKSTSLAAIEDLLFGIPKNSSYNFLHDYSNMRIGGILQQEDQSLEFWRRKGNKDTLLGPRDVPLVAGERELLPFLNGADRNFFIRMFSLDHERLAEGGEEILKAKDEVGQTLFSAGTGIAGLREHISELAKEADELWAPRKSDRREYYKASKALEDADADCRNNIVTAAEWIKTKQNKDETEKDYRELEEKIRSSDAENRKLSRIRRVYRTVHKLADIENKISELGDMPVLPETAEADLENAEKKEAGAQSKIEQLTRQLEGAKDERKNLVFDEELIRRADDIQLLHTRRIEVQKEKSDLPKRRIELGLDEAQLRDRAQDLGWDSENIDVLISRLPARAAVSVARGHYSHRGEVSSALRSATENLKDAEQKLEDERRELQSAPAAVDVSALATVLAANRSLSDIGTRISTAEKDLSIAETDLGRQINQLRPSVASPKALAVLPVPPRSTVQDHRDSFRELLSRIKKCEDAIATAERQLQIGEKAYDRRIEKERVLAPEALTDARNERDAGWALIRKKYIDQVPVSEEEMVALIGSAATVPDAYESLVRISDDLADRRFDKAHAAGEIAAVARQIAESRDDLEGLRQEKQSLEKDREALDRAWADIWAEASFDPLDPDLMLAWLDCRTGALDLAAGRDEKASQLASLNKEQTEAIELILPELGALGEKTGKFTDQPLRLVLQAGAELLQKHEKNAERRSAFEANIRKLEAIRIRKVEQLDAAKAAWDDWSGRWEAAIQSLGLDAKASPDVVADQLETIDEMRVTAENIQKLKRDRIAKIEQDIESFQASADKLVDILAPELKSREPEDVSLELDGRLESAKSIEREQKLKDKLIKDLQESIEQCETDVRVARNSYQRLQEVAGAENVSELSEAIRKCNLMRQLDGDRAMLLGTLAGC